MIIIGVRLYREALIRVLGERHAIRLTGEAASANDGLATIAAVRPDVVLLDLQIAGALELLRRVRDVAPATRVIALGFAGTEAQALMAAEAGVSGYIGIQQPLGDVLPAIDGVMRGEAPCGDGRIVAALLRRVEAAARARPADETPLRALTRSERRTLELVARGLSNKQIATELVVSVPTVKSHVHAILRKLGVAHRGEAADILRRTDLASMPRLG